MNPKTIGAYLAGGVIVGVGAFAAFTGDEFIPQEDICDEDAMIYTIQLDENGVFTGGANASYCPLEYMKALDSDYEVVQVPKEQFDKVLDEWDAQKVGEAIEFTKGQKAIDLEEQKKEVNNEAVYKNIIEQEEFKEIKKKLDPDADVSEEDKKINELKLKLQ